MFTRIYGRVVDSVGFTSIAPAFFAAILASGCVGQDTPPAVQDLDGGGIGPADSAHLSGLPGPGSRETVGALIVANDCRMTAEVLADEAGLFARSAGAIANARAGRDEVCGTADDLRFRSLDELLDLPFTGPRNIERLVRFAETAGAMPLYAGGTVAGVDFTDAEAFNALTSVNGASFSVLNREAGLRSDAVENIIEARPIKSLAELATVYRVGPVTLELLRNWSSPRVRGGLVLDADRFAELETLALSFLLENEIFAWELVQLSDYDAEVLAELQSALEQELRRIVEISLIGRPFLTADAARLAVLQVASGIQRQVRVEGWSYLHDLGI